MFTIVRPYSFNTLCAHLNSFLALHTDRVVALNILFEYIMAGDKWCLNLVLSIVRPYLFNTCAHLNLFRHFTLIEWMFGMPFFNTIWQEINDARILVFTVVRPQLLLFLFLVKSIVRPFIFNRSMFETLSKIWQEHHDMTTWVILIPPIYLKKKNGNNYHNINSIMKYG